MCRYLPKTSSELFGKAGTRHKSGRVADVSKLNKNNYTVLGTRQYLLVPWGQCKMPWGGHFFYSLSSMGPILFSPSPAIEFLHPWGGHFFAFNSDNT